MDTAEGRVFDEGPFDVYRLKLLAILLVEEGNCDVVSEAKGLVEEGKSLAIADETDAAEKNDFGLLSVATIGLEVFTASKAEK